MSSQTRRTLEDFDNQHDFERLSADILNALGYSDVEPMAPRGGADGAQDIKFREGDAAGIAFATLDKRIKGKFKHDLAQQSDAEGLIALFCNVDVSPAMKLAFSRDAIAKGFRLQIFDLERIRSLLDSTLKELRRRYLHIDDEIAERLRVDVSKLLTFPDAIADEPPAPTKLERMLTNRLPRRLFELLMRYSESDVREVPGIGTQLHAHMKTYYGFRQAVKTFEGALFTRIAAVMGPELSFPGACHIHLEYALFRFSEITKEQVSAGANFLNWGITWESAERMFEKLAADSALTSQVAELNRQREALDQSVRQVALLEPDIAT